MEQLDSYQKFEATYIMLSILGVYLWIIIGLICVFAIPDPNNTYSPAIFIYNGFFSIFMTIANHYILLRNAVSFQELAVSLSQNARDAKCIFSCLLCRPRCCFSICLKRLQNENWHKTNDVANVIYLIYSLVMIIVLFLSEDKTDTPVAVIMYFHTTFHFSTYCLTRARMWQGGICFVLIAHIPFVFWLFGALCY